MKSIFSLIMLLSSVNAFSQYQLEDFRPLHRLAVSWEMKTKKGLLVEQWTKVNDSLMQAKSFRVSGTDTIPQETVTLAFNSGKISYTPVVPDQNEGKPVSFTLIKIEGSKFTFENKAHDFPQQIIYTLMDKALNVTINGNTKNGFKEIPFSFILK